MDNDHSRKLVLVVFFAIFVGMIATPIVAECVFRPHTSSYASWLVGICATLLALLLAEWIMRAAQWLVDPEYRRNSDRQLSDREQAAELISKLLTSNRTPADAFLQNWPISSDPLIHECRAILDACIDKRRGVFDELELSRRLSEISDFLGKLRS